MNIAAVMAALDIWDLDPVAKHAVKSVAIRADRYSCSTTTSIARLAADMGIHRITALRALNRAVEAGYLTVDKSAGRTPTWHLTCSGGLQVGVADGYGGVLPSATGPRDSGSRAEESLEKPKSGAVASLARRASNGAVERRLPPAVPPGPPLHPESCSCGGTGWVDAGAGDRSVARCPGRLNGRRR